MGLFEQNLDAVMRLNPRLAERLRSDEEDAVVAVSPTQEGAPTMGVRRDGRLYMLHHPQTPLSDTRRLIASIGDAHRSWNFIFLGVGLGYAPLLLLEGRVKPPELMVLLEPSISVFRAACKTLDLRPVLGSFCRLIVGETASALYEALSSNLTMLLANQVTLIKHPPTAGLYPDWMRESEERFRDVWRFAEMSLATKNQNGPQFVSNLLNNLPVFAHSRGVLPGCNVLGRNSRPDCRRRAILG